MPLPITLMYAGIFAIIALLLSFLAGSARGRAALVAGRVRLSCTVTR
jgi:hypothetical protein